MQKKILAVENLFVNFEKLKILDDISFNVYQNDFLMIVGPNGCGKTTLIRAIMNTIYYSGNVLLNGKTIKKTPIKELAKSISVVSQENSSYFSFSVRETVALGRYCYNRDTSFLSPTKPHIKKVDQEKIDYALELTKVSHLQNRKITSLSGGELQRVYLAKAFAQDSNLLILDEPTNHLDLQHQIALFEIINVWRKQNERAVICIAHDLNMAFAFSNLVLLMKNGSIVDFGSAKQVLCKKNLIDVYNFDLNSWMKNQYKNWA